MYGAGIRLYSPILPAKFGQRLFTTHPHVSGYIFFETRTGDEKDDNNSLQHFGVLHLLQREIVKKIRS